MCKQKLICKIKSFGVIQPVSSNSNSHGSPCCSTMEVGVAAAVGTVEAVLGVVELAEEEAVEEVVEEIAVAVCVPTLGSRINNNLAPFVTAGGNRANNRANSKVVDDPRVHH